MRRTWVRIPLRALAQWVHTLSASKHARIASRLLGTAALVAIASHFASGVTWIRESGERWLDFLAAAMPARPAPQVVVVDIDSAAFHDSTLFGSTSPLDPSTIARLVRNIASHAPKALVIDLLMHPSPSDHGRLRDGRLHLYDVLDSLSRQGMPIVVVIAQEEEITAALPDSELVQRWSALLYPDSARAAPIVGADGRFHLEHGVVRSVSLLGLENSEGQQKPTVLGATAAVAEIRHLGTRDWASEHEDNASEWRIRYTGAYTVESGEQSRFRAVAHDVLPAMERSGRTLLTDKIVVLGGTYPDARDEFLTPLGPMPGSHVWAEAIGSLIRNDAPHHASAILTLLLETTLGFLVGLLLLRFGPAWGFLLSVAGVLPLSVLASLVSYGVGAFFVGFLPSVVGVYIHYQVEVHQELERLRAEIKAARGAPCATD